MPFEIPVEPIVTKTFVFLGGINDVLEAPVKFIVAKTKTVK